MTSNLLWQTSTTIRQQCWPTLVSLYENTAVAILSIVSQKTCNIRMVEQMSVQQQISLLYFFALHVFVAKDTWQGGSVLRL